MCKLKSAIILKDRIFMPDYDSHSEMLNELGIVDDYLGATKKFVRAELSPENGDVFSPVEEWLFRVDQDITPDWFSEEEYKPLMVEAVKKWAETHIHIGTDGLKIASGKNHYIKDCKDVDICGNATVKYICDNATVEYIYGNATVKYIYGNATVKNICGNATVEYIRGNATVEYIRGNATVEYICDNATVEYIYGNATVKYIYGNATVKNICGNATVEYIRGNATVVSPSCTKWRNAESLIIADNATFKDHYAKVIYQSGDYKLISVESGKKIGDAK